MQKLPPPSWGESAKVEQEKEGETRAKSEVLDRPRNHEESNIGLAQPIRDYNHAHYQEYKQEQRRKRHEVCFIYLNT